MSDLKTTFREQIFNDYSLESCLRTKIYNGVKIKTERRQYPKLLKMFLDHIKLDLSLTFEERVNSLYENPNTEKNW